jgi:predicted transposase YdaD
VTRAQPHDALFKAAFTDPAHAVPHLRLLLPPRLAARVDFAHLAVVPGSFVDPKLRLRHTDILYGARIGRRKALIYVLHEHQSSVDTLMPLRLLAYMLRIWEAHLARHAKAKRLPAILPLVVYHGDTRWHAATSFHDLLDVDDEDRADLAPFVPQFSFLLDDLTQAADASLRARRMTAFGRLVLWLLKRTRDQNPEHLLRGLVAWGEVLRELVRAPNGAAALELALRYIIEVRSDVAPEELPALIGQGAGPEAEEIAMNGLQKLIEKGRVEGRSEGARQTLLRQLAAKFGDLPAAVTARVQAASETEVEAWTLRVLTAAILADVFAEPRHAGAASGPGPQAKPRARR